jgi:hypothetical protein
MATHCRDRTSGKSAFLDDPHRLILRDIDEHLIVAVLAAALSLWRPDPSVFLLRSRRPLIAIQPTIHKFRAVLRMLIVSLSKRRTVRDRSVSFARMFAAVVKPSRWSSTGKGTEQCGTPMKRVEDWICRQWMLFGGMWT